MRNKYCFHIIVGLLTLVFIFSCSNSTSPSQENYALILNDTNSVKLNEYLLNSNENLRLSFKNLLEDSRCPIGAECFWEGNAKVEIEFIIGDETHLLELNTYYNFQRDSTLNNYYLKLIDVLPYPTLDGSYLDEESIIKIFISKNY